MPVLTVFLAPAGPAGGILDVLADLSGAGLVDPFLWVQDSAVADFHLGGTDVRGGRRAPTGVEEALADQQFDRVRLCVLVPLIGSAPAVSSQVEQHVAQRIAAAAGGARITRIRCSFTRPGCAPGPAELARQGWHNVLIAPEDSRGPGLGHQVLPASSDPIDIGRHAAPAVAGITALWSGVDRCVLDDRPIPPEESVRAARSYFRRVDAEDVERELRERVLTTRPFLPLPREYGVSAVYVEDVGLACRTMAANLWTKHRAVLFGPRVAADPGVIRPLGWRESIKWLFGFILAALKNAPEEWYRAKVGQFSSRAAAASHKLVFGPGEAAYKVVVNGMTAEGVPAGWQEMEDASGRLDDLFTGPSESSQHQAYVDLSPVWKDYAGGALTLADAGDRGGAAMPPVQIGPNRGVLRSVADCTAGIDDAFTEVPAHLVGPTGVTSVQVGDVLGADLLRRKLQHIALEPALAADANRTVQGLGAWLTRFDGTYVAQIGRALGGRLLATRSEVEQLLEKLREAGAPPETDPADHARRRALARSIWIIVVLASIAIMTMAGLAGFRTVTVINAVLVGVGIAVVALLIALICFAQGHRELFRYLTRRKALMAEAEADQRNLLQAVKDLRRLSEAYRQYLLWTQVISSVLRGPFGSVAPTATATAHIGRGLPRTTGIARALVDEAVLARVSIVLRGDLFTTGWLSTPWEASLNGAATQLGPRGYELAQHPDALFDLRRGASDGSLLQAWSDVLAREGTSATVGDAVWTTVMGSLAGNREVVAVELLSSVQGMAVGDRPAGTLAEFLSGIDQPATGGQRFDGAHFTARAQAAERSRVAISEPVRSRLGLSRVVALVQLTDAVPPYEFATGEAPAEPYMSPTPHEPVYVPPLFPGDF